MLKRNIEIKFTKEGIHCYPAAPDEVAFLRDLHRHIFHFYVKLEVFHNDRDVEFIMFKRELEALYKYSAVVSINHKSCEMLAEDLIDYVKNKYPNRDTTVRVYEDDENGAVLEYVK